MKISQLLNTNMGINDLFEYVDFKEKHNPWFTCRLFYRENAPIKMFVDRMNRDWVVNEERLVEARIFFREFNKVFGTNYYLDMDIVKIRKNHETETTT